MSLFDRYTIQRWKTFWIDLVANVFDSLSRLYALCNNDPKARLVALGCLVFIVFLLVGLFSLVKPKPTQPINKKLVLRKTDEQGNAWTIDYKKNQNLQAISTGDKKPGEPLTLKVKFLRKSQYLLIQPEIIGAAGEKYFPGILKNGQWQEPPKLVISDQNGKKVHTGQFEYG